jgi:hypothetical protein
MLGHGKYLAFGLLVIASYWYTVHNGIVYLSFDQSPSGAPARAGRTSARGRSSSSWGGGFQGGK